MKFPRLIDNSMWILDNTLFQAGGLFTIASVILHLSINCCETACETSFLLFNQAIFDFDAVEFFQHGFGGDEDEDHRCGGMDQIHGKAGHIGALSDHHTGGCSRSTQL